MKIVFSDNLDHVFTGLNKHPVRFFSENDNLTPIPLELKNRGLISGHSRSIL